MSTIEYFFTPVSPWAYLGHDRFTALAGKHGATVKLMPMDLAKVFPISGGLPLPKRAPQRQAYRLTELARWRDYLGIPINFQPKFVASSGELATRWILAANERSTGDGMALAGAVMRSRWADEGDIADEDTLAKVASSVGQDAKALGQRAVADAIGEAYATSTQAAIDRQVFGAPTYIVDGEMFWGQDRLDFLARKLAK